MELFSNFEITLYNSADFYSLYYALNRLNGIKMRVLFDKNIEKNHLCHHDKNYYYFCKLDIPAINCILGSIN